MIKVEIHETIHRPVEEVFDRLTDIPSYTNWMPSSSIFRGATASPVPATLDTQYEEETLLGKLSGDVSAIERPTSLTFHYRAYVFGRLMMQGWPGYVLEPEGEGSTRVHHTGVAETYGPFKLLEPLFKLIARRERGITVRALKRSLEDGSDA